MADASPASTTTAASSSSTSSSSSSSSSSSASASSALTSAAAFKSSTTSSLFLSSTIAVPDADEVILGTAAVLYCQMAADANSGRRCPTRRINDMLLFSEDLYLPDNRTMGKAQADVASRAKALMKRMPLLLAAKRSATEAGDDARLAETEALLTEASAESAALEAEWATATAGAVPSIETMYKMIQKIHELGQFSPETVILSLILINRVISSSGMPVGPKNWRLVCLIATLLAQKVWDDASVGNSDFPSLLMTVLPGAVIDVKNINRLERRFLSLIEFKVSIPGSLYAKYYFELRGVAEENHRKFRLAPLSKEQGDRLEARSRSKGASLRDAATETLRRAKTADDSMAPRSRAVLS